LHFTADEDGGLGRIEEFRSGHFDDDGAGIQSGVNLGNATLHLDIQSIAGGAAQISRLIEVDEIIGSFDDLEISGLGSDQDASVLIDYANDTVELSLGAAGQGKGNVSLYTVGDEADAKANAELWAALTNGHGIYPDDLPEDIPAEDGEAMDI
jgi:hypothetical protein